MSGGIVKAFGTVGGWTLASRVLGLVRDKLFAQFVGAGAILGGFFSALFNSDFF